MYYFKIIIVIIGKIKFIFINFHNFIPEIQIMGTAKKNGKRKGQLQPEARRV